MRNFVICLVMLVMFGTVNAATINLTIDEGVNGSDGFVTLGRTDIVDSAGSLMLGLPTYGWSNAVQTYFEIPAELKAPGVVINSATLSMYIYGMDDGAAAPYNANTVDGYNGVYFKLMHYTYDTGTVSVANAEATADPANYTNVGGTHFQTNTATGFQLWDITSNLQADITAGWTYSPYVTRLTYNDGTFTGSPFGPEGYMAYFYNSEIDNAPYEPHLVIDYTVIPEPATMLLLSLGGLVLRRRRA